MPDALGKASHRGAARHRVGHLTRGTCAPLEHRAESGSKMLAGSSLRLHGGDILSERDFGLWGMGWTLQVAHCLCLSSLFSAGATEAGL